MWQHPVAWAYNFKCLLVGGQIWSFTQLALILDFESGKKTLIFNLTIMKILSVTVSEVSEKITIVSKLIWYYIGMFYFVLLLVKKTLDDPWKHTRHDMATPVCPRFKHYFYTRFPCALCGGSYLSGVIKPSVLFLIFHIVIPTFTCRDKTSVCDQ